LEPALQRAKGKMEDEHAYQTAEIHKGFLYDPRQTDNAWVEVKAFLLYGKDEVDLEGVEGEGAKIWKTLDHVMINNLHSSHGYIVRKALQYLYDESWNKDDIVFNILDKTG
jgi:hypothetical protein